MRYTLLFALLLVSITSFGQKVIELGEPAAFTDKLKKGAAIMYGLFIPRPKAGGGLEMIYIKNLDNGKEYSFIAKSTYHSKKNNNFRYYVAPGHYAISGFLWSEDKWYGIRQYRESVIKGHRISELDKQIKSGEVNTDTLELFHFTIAPDAITYVGTWHFEDELIHFTDDKKEQTDKEKEFMYMRKIPLLNAALTSIPE